MSEDAFVLDGATAVGHTCYALLARYRQFSKERASGVTIASKSTCSLCFRGIRRRAMKTGAALGKACGRDQNGRGAHFICALHQVGGAPA